MDILFVSRECLDTRVVRIILIIKHLPQPHANKDKQSRQMNNQDSFVKKEIWEEESFNMDESRDTIQDMTASLANIEPSNSLIKEELKAQEDQMGAAIFTIADLEKGDEINTDSATMSELDEINPPDQISYNPKFFEAAREFITVVDVQAGVPKKGRTFVDYLLSSFNNIQSAAKTELKELNHNMELMNELKDQHQVPRSSKFTLFADELIKRATDERTLERMTMNFQTERIYQAVFKKFLAKSYAEAKYLLQQMVIVVKQSSPDFELDQSQYQPMDNTYTYASQDRTYTQTQGVSHLLLDINRTRAADNMLSKEESAQQLFNYSVFKLACIFERVRLYMHDIVQPRDNKLQVIEVNLDTDRNKMIIEGENMVNIWEKNDFIMTYQVLQIINNEIKRIEKKNLDRSLFTDQINDFLDYDARDSRNDSFKSDITTDTLMVPKTRSYESSEEAAQVQHNRRIMQSFFLQNQSNLGRQAFQINADRWEKFTRETRKKQLRKQQRTLEESQSMGQEVFLLFKLELRKPIDLPEGVTRTFQLELMYFEGSAVSQKVKFTQLTQPSAGLQNANTSEEHAFLFLQVPFKLLLGTDVYMIIKVFSNIPSKSATEQQHIWTPSSSQERSKQMRNTFKFYEGYTLVNISDAFWTKNLKCGQMFTHPSIHFYKPDKVQIVDDRFVQILKERSFVKHPELQEQYRPRVSYALYSSLVAHARELDLDHTRIIMMKRFTNKLFQSRDLSASQFLKNEPGSNVRSYSNEQLYAIDKQIRMYLQNLNEIKLDLHSLHFNDSSLVKQPFVRLQIFLRQKDQGCFEQVYGTFENMFVKTYSHQTFIVPVHQNRAILRDTCFLKLPTKDQSSLIDLQILVCVQFPILTSNFMSVTDKNGNKINSEAVYQRLGIKAGQPLEYDHYLDAPDLITFKTEFVNEIPLYDFVQESVIQSKNDSKLAFKRFVQKGFTINKQSPCLNLQDEPGVILSFGIDVLSLYFTQERPFNIIITLYDSKKSLNDIDIKTILMQTKEITPRVMMFHAEKLLTILVNIFCRTQNTTGSSYAFEAILYVIKFFKSQKLTKDQRVVDDFITKHLEIQQQDSPIYPKLLYQIIMFSDHLKKSLKAGKPMGNIAQHFTLFREMPTIMSFLRKSFELEQTQIEVGRMNAKRNQERINNQRKDTVKMTKRPPMEAKDKEDIKNDLHIVDSFIEGVTKVPQESNAALNQTRFSHQVAETEGMEGLDLSKHDLHQSVRQTDLDFNKQLMGEESKQGNLAASNYNVNGSTFTNEFDAPKDGLQTIQDEVPIVHEVMGDHDKQNFDELMDQREYRVDSVSSRQDSKYHNVDEMRHPTRRLTILDNTVIRPQRLLYKIQMPRDEFQQVIEIILNNIVECLHRDINKSCFTLRMIFYKNLCGILEHVVTYLSQKTIWDIFQNLVKPLKVSQDNNLGIEQNQDENLGESQRMTMANLVRDKQQSQLLLANNLDNKSSLTTEKQVVQEKGGKQRMQNVRMRVMNYLSQENFWVSEIVGQEEVNTNEFVRRIITMGQFLESKAIEKLPNNPYLGRRISSQFAQFISESSGDFSAHKKNSTFLQNISKNLKAHSLLYILHQSFKHENRFAQLFDLGQGIIVHDPDDDGDGMMMQAQMISTMRGGQTMSTRVFNRQSMAISDQDEDDDGTELLQLTNDQESKKKNRLYYFTKDSDYYTTLLLQIVKTMGDVELPKEITETLEPVREKCQLIIFQLVTLLNRATLSWFIHRKKQLRSLLQNMIELVMSDSLEFRSPFTLYGGEKKMRVFQRFTMNLSQELVSERQYSQVLSYKDTYRPILSSLWLIILMIYIHRVKVVNDGPNPPKTEDEYQDRTWNMFEQFQQFWCKFKLKKRILVQTEQANEKLFHNLVIETMRKAVTKEAKHGVFFTCNNLLKLLFHYEQEYFKLKSSDKLDMLTQLVRICQVLNEHSQNYIDEFKTIEIDPEYDTCLFIAMQDVYEQFRREDKRPDFIAHLNDIIQKFRQIERRILLLKVAERNQDLLYRGFCEYEQLKIFMNMNLDYISAIFSHPLSKYKKLLESIQKKMQAEDDDEDNCLMNMESITGAARLPSTVGKIATNANAHFKAEIAFSHVKEHELVEASCSKGRLALGSANIELDLRVNLMQEACARLRQNRFFLMAIQLKEKEKNLLIQSFQYDEQTETNEANSSSVPSQVSQLSTKHNVFNTLNDERTIHKDIQKFKTSVKQFCTYFSIKFFGKNLPVELKRKEGYIFRGLASQSTFQLEEDLTALYGNVVFVNDGEKFDDMNCVPMRIRLEKVQPFTVQKRKKFRISEKEKKISQTMSTNSQKYPPEFKEYFEQNFRKQFYKTNRKVNDQLKAQFQRHATSLMPSALNSDHGDEMSKEQSLKFYQDLHTKHYDKTVNEEDQQKFWKKLQKEGFVNSDGRISQEDMLKVNTEEWKGLTPMLSDLEIHVFEVAETFPTMYNMQAVCYNLVSRIAGVEQENNNWQKRIKKQMKARTAVQNVFSLTQMPEDNDENGYQNYIKKVGPALRDLWNEIRMDIDTDQNGGVLMTLEVFFPNKDSLKRLALENEDTFRKYLNLFVTIETWFIQIQTSLLLFEEKNKLYDEYQRIMNPNDKLVMDNSVNWFSKFMLKRGLFEKVRKKCDIDEALREEEEAMVLEDSD